MAISEQGMVFFISRKKFGFNLNITKNSKLVYEEGHIPKARSPLDLD